MDVSAGSTDCVNGMLRLFGGSSQGNGRVEVCIGRRWATICAPQFMNSINAAVACSQLGYESEGTK